MQGAGPLRKEGFSQGEGFWKSHKKDLPVLLPLPLSHSQSPGSQNYRGERAGGLSLSWKEQRAHGQYPW